MIITRDGELEKNGDFNSEVQHRNGWKFEIEIG